MFVKQLLVGIRRDGELEHLVDSSQVFLHVEQILVLEFGVAVVLDLVHAGVHIQIQTF